MPPSLPQALEAEVKRQGVPADQIQKLELDQKCRAAAIQVLWPLELRFLLSGYPKQHFAPEPVRPDARNHSMS